MEAVFSPTAIWYTASTIAQSVAALLAFGAFVAQWRRSDLLKRSSEDLQRLFEVVREFLSDEMGKPDQPPPVMRPANRIGVYAYLMKQHPEAHLTLYSGSDWYEDASNIVDVLEAVRLLLAHRSVIEPRIDDKHRFSQLVACMAMCVPTTTALTHIRRALVLLVGAGTTCIALSVLILPVAEFANVFAGASVAAGGALATSFLMVLAATLYVAWAALSNRAGWKHQQRNAIQAFEKWRVR